MGTNGLPVIPSGANPPFQVGSLPATVTIPILQARDQTCAQIFTTLFRYLPDVGKFFDYSTTVPTLNIGSRATMPVKTIKAVTSNLLKDGYAVSGFDPEALYEQQVPAVFIKYATTSTVNGQANDTIVEDAYPAGALENAPRAFVQTADLQGSRAVFQHQDVTVADMPYDETAPIAWDWVRQNPLLAQLFGTTLNPSKYDVSGISLQSIVTTIDPKDPNNTNPQSGLGVTDPDTGTVSVDLHAVPEELVAGQIATWMITDQGVLACKVFKTITLTYSGSDAATLAKFNSDPNQGNTLVIVIETVATNASTQTYQQMTSFSQGETPPLGYAQYLYNILSWLHQAGELEITEKECSGLLPLGYVFNTSDGAAEWQAMSALIIAVAYDLDAGKNDGALRADALPGTGAVAGTPAGERRTVSAAEPDAAEHGEDGLGQRGHRAIVYGGSDVGFAGRRRGRVGESVGADLKGANGRRVCGGGEREQPADEITNGGGCGDGERDRGGKPGQHQFRRWVNRLHLSGGPDYESRAVGRGGREVGQCGRNVRPHAGGLGQRREGVPGVRLLEQPDLFQDFAGEDFDRRGGWRRDARADVDGVLRFQPEGVQHPGERASGLERGAGEYGLGLLMSAGQLNFRDKSGFFPFYIRRRRRHPSRERRTPTT